MGLPPQTRLRVVQCRIAPIWRRAVAYVMDKAVLLLALEVISILLGDENPLSMVMFVLVCALYGVLCVYRFGGTVGKLALGLRVTSVNAMPVTMLQSFLRYSPYLVLDGLSLLIMNETLEKGKDLPPDVQLVATLSLVWLVASVYALFSSKERRTLHDHLAYTFVVEIQPAGKE